MSEFFKVCEIQNNQYTTLCCAYDVPSGVTKISDIGICGVKAKVINLPNTLKSIGLGGITSNDYLETITIPSSCKTIGYQALANNISLTTVTIESGCTYMDQQVFVGDTKLSKVYIPNTVKKMSYDIYKSNVFDGIESKVTVYSEKGSYAYNYCKTTLGMKVVDTSPATPTTVKLKASKNTATSVKLAWSSSKNATEYRIYQYVSKKWVKLGVTTSTNYIVSNLTSASSVKFKVIPVNVKSNGEKSGTAATVTTYTKNVTPVLSTITKKSTSSAKISLVKDKTAKYYEIYVSKNNKNYSKAINIKNSSSGISSYTLKTGLKKSGTNYIKVRAYSVINGNKVYSSYSNVIKVSLK